MAPQTTASPDRMSGRALEALGIATPHPLRDRITRLAGQRALLSSQIARATRDREVLKEYLARHEKVAVALESLSERLFSEVLVVIEEKLTIALQEVLEQPIRFRAKAEWKRSSASVSFCVEREGQAEDIMRGQGGSVANILSVGLRMFALMTLDPAKHRRFLVLDEQDCWLQPELVPRLVKIVHEAGKALGFQTLMISHHSPHTFSRYADAIYEVFSNGSGPVSVERWQEASDSPDH